MTTSSEGIAKKPLGGPWLRIARRVLAGNDDIDKLKLCAADAIERQKVQGNVNAMLQLGFLAEANGKLALTSKGKGLMP